MKQKIWQQRVSETRERLREPLQWYPLPAAIAFCLAMFLTSHAVMGINPRIGHHAAIIQFGSEPAQETALWISAVQIGDEIVVTTHDRKVFRWPHNIRSAKEIESFVNYLKNESNEEIMTAALAGEAFEPQTILRVAVDQRLKFRHFRPILFAMAKAGISRYAFETQISLASGPESVDETL